MKRKIILIFLGCGLAVMIVGYVAVGGQDPGSRAAKRAASQLVDAQGGLSLVIKLLVAQRPAYIQQVAHMTGLEVAQATHVTDEVLLPEIIAHASEVRASVQDAYAASFSANDLHSLQRCWALMSHKAFATTDIPEINRCQASHAAKMWPKEQTVINQRMQAAGLAFGLKYLPAALSRSRDKLREEGITVREGTTR